MAKIINLIKSSRDDALNARARAEFSDNVIAADKYIKGDQYPDWYDPETSKDPYIVINIFANMIDVLAAMVAGGRVKTILDSRSPVPDELLEIARMHDLAWQEMTNFSGHMYEAVRHMAMYGIGVVRGYVDPFEMIDMGGRLGVETIYPLQIWISPLARDPYDALMGSNYIGYEQYMTRGDLVAQYPENARKIKELEADTGVGDNDVNGNEDPVSYAARTKGDSSEHLASATGRNDWSEGYGAVSRQREDRDLDLIRVLDFEWCEVVAEEVETGIGDPIKRYVKKWYSCRVAGDFTSNSPRNYVILEEEAEIPYGCSTFVIVPAWLRADSPYCMGLLNRMGDSQESLNVVMSMVTKEAMLAQRFASMLFLREDVLSPEDINHIKSDIPPELTLVRPPDGEQLDVRQIAQRFDSNYQNFGELMNIANMFMSFIKDVTGLHGPVTGDQNLARTSGIVLGEAQAAISSAQEGLKRHIDAAATNLARLGLRMRKWHWSGQHRIPTIGAQAGPAVNIRMPMNDANLALVGDMASTGNYRMGGEVAVPNAIHVSTLGGREATFGIEDVDGASEAMNSMPGSFAEIGFNNMEMLDIGIKAVVEADFKQRQKDIMTILGTIINLKGDGAVSAETLWREGFADNPTMSWDKEREKVLGEAIASLVKQIEQQSPELQQQIMQVIQQQVMMAQQAQQQGAAMPQQQGGNAMAQAGVPANGVRP